MKQPLPINLGASLDVSWDWTKWLAGDSIASFSVISQGGMVVTAGPTLTGGKVTAQVSLGGVPQYGSEFTVTCGVTTSSNPPRSDSRDMTFIVQRR
jgi:hypothetical protein